jgi:hypothetical protein
MKSFQDFDLCQKLARFGVQATGHIASRSAVVLLVLAWVITSPLVQLSDLLFAGNEKNKNEKIKI